MNAGWLPIFLLLIFLGAICLPALYRWMRAVPIANDPERKRIVDLIESGKVTSEEGAELLDAMGKSSALRGQDQFSHADIVLLIGIAIVVLGFFTPWAKFGHSPASGMFRSVSGYQAGYHTGAAGWTMFIIAILSAVPVFVSPRNYLYKMSMLQLFLVIIGLVMVISFLISAADQADRMHFGLIFCLLGFLLELFASITKIKVLAA